MLDCISQYHIVSLITESGVKHQKSINQPVPPVSSTNKTVRHDITEILLKVMLNTIKPTN
jgi:hypothetical protein